MKYAALTLSTLSVAILAWGAVTMTFKMGPGGRPAPLNGVSIQPLSDQQLKDQTEVREALDAMREVAMSRRMRDFPGDSDAQGLMSHSARRLQPQFDSVFASAPPEAVKVALTAAPRLPRSMATGPVPASLPVPRVSLVLQAGNESRAMVDGRLVRVGDPVAEGMLVKSISIESVVFAANGEDLVVAVPLERLRVLGAFPSPRAKGN